MAEYIKRWDVINACYDIYEEVVREHKAMTTDKIKQTMLRFEKAIQLTPTADVVEVKHGEWEQNPYCKEYIFVLNVVGILRTEVLTHTSIFPIVTAVQKWTCRKSRQVAKGEIHNG